MRWSTSNSCLRQSLLCWSGTRRTCHCNAACSLEGLQHLSWAEGILEGLSFATLVVNRSVRLTAAPCAAEVLQVCPEPGRAPPNISTLLLALMYSVGTSKGISPAPIRRAASVSIFLGQRLLNVLHKGTQCVKTPSDGGRKLTQSRECLVQGHQDNVAALTELLSTAHSIFRLQILFCHFKSHLLQKPLCIQEPAIPLILDWVPYSGIDSAVHTETPIRLTCSGATPRHWIGQVADRLYTDRSVDF